MHVIGVSWCRMNTGSGVHALDWQEAQFHSLGGLTSSSWIIQEPLETFSLWKKISLNFHFQVGIIPSIGQSSVVAISCHVGELPNTYCAPPLDLVVPAPQEVGALQRKVIFLLWASLSPQCSSWGLWGQFLVLSHFPLGPMLHEWLRGPLLGSERTLPLFSSENILVLRPGFRCFSFAFLEI